VKCYCRINYLVLKRKRKWQQKKLSQDDLTDDLQVLIWKTYEEELTKSKKKLADE
jgi:hypothetical protein